MSSLGRCGHLQKKPFTQGTLFPVASRISRHCSMNKNPLINLCRRCQIRRWHRSRCEEWSLRYRYRLHLAAVFGQNPLIFINFEAAPWDRAATNRGTLGILARLRVAGHACQPGGRSDGVAGRDDPGPQLAPRSGLRKRWFFRYLRTTLKGAKRGAVQEICLAWDGARTRVSAAHREYIGR